MPHLTVTTRAGDKRIIEVPVGRSLMEGIRDAGINDIAAVCGGCASCSTCHVYVDPERMAELPPIGEQEDALLDCSDARRSNSRLSCQVIASASIDGLLVTIAPAD